MNATLYTSSVISKKGVTGIGVLNQHCAPAAEPRSSCGFFIRVSSFGGSDRGPLGPPVHASAARYANLSELPPSIGVEGGGFSKPQHLEATMALSVSTRASAQNPTTSVQLDLVNIEATAHNGLARALRELRSNQPNYELAAQQAHAALAAIRTLDIACTFSLGGV